MFREEVLEKIKTDILYWITFFWKSRQVWEFVEKYGSTLQATERIACWVTKVRIETHIQKV